MNNIKSIALAGFCLGAAGTIWADSDPALKSPTPAPAPVSGAAPSDSALPQSSVVEADKTQTVAELAKSDAAKPTEAAPKAARKEEARAQFEHQIPARVFAAYYSNLSQAKLKISVQKLFDPVIARQREYFMGELTGAGIVTPIIFDADDLASRSVLIGVLERFASESKKSGELAKRMQDRKKALEEELSIAETSLVELKDATSAKPEAIAKQTEVIAKLRESIVVADEISKMKSISGNLGTAKLHPNRPAYEFLATFEPGKQLYILRAGYGVQISSKDVDYFLDLLKRVPEFKQQLIDGESKDKRLRAEVKALFESAGK